MNPGNIKRSHPLASEAQLELLRNIRPVDLREAVYKVGVTKDLKSWEYSEALDRYQNKFITLYKQYIQLGENE